MISTNFNKIVVELTVRKVYANRAIVVNDRKQLERKSNYIQLAHIFGSQIFMKLNNNFQKYFHKKHWFYTPLLTHCALKLRVNVKSELYKHKSKKLNK